MSYDLERTINNINQIHDRESNQLTIPDDYLYPSSIVVIAAHAHANRIRQANLIIPQARHGYLEAVGVGSCLFGQDSYPNQRVNSGVNYSPLVHIQDIDAVDTATSTINSCITLLSGRVNTRGVNELKHVIGELHDNVWSHGLESGFSLAQKSKIPQSPDFCINFALADTGLGFFEEMSRARIGGVSCHRDAIEWCIQRGNTTKPSTNDPWAQSLPSDCTASPFPQITTNQTTNGNHHQGLGLAKLIDLVNTYNGELDIASGDTILQVRGNQKHYKTLQASWKGVAISCKLNLSELCNGSAPPEIPSKIQSIIDRLRG